MLFVIVMEVLNSLFGEAVRQGALSPLPGRAIRHRVSLYADDLVLLVSPTPEDLACVRHILDLFAGASGLLTNYEKCSAILIRCSEEMIGAIQSAFPCVLGSFPCRYLGVPLSLQRLRHADEQPLVDAIAARIPTWKAGLLSNAGRTLLTKVTLSAIPVHLSIACCLSKWAVDQIDKRRRAFLWAGSSSVAGGKCKVAWPIVCRPSGLGGLGVLDLRFFGFALRLRWEWLARTSSNAGWASLPHRPEKVVATMAGASMTVSVGNGCSARFWSDSWTTVGALCRFAPDLFAAISRAGRKRSMSEGLLLNRWVWDIVGAPTVQVLASTSGYGTSCTTYLWTQCRRTASSGVGVRMASTQPLLPTGRSSSDQHRSWELRSSGKQRRRRG